MESFDRGIIDEGAFINYVDTFSSFPLPSVFCLPSVTSHLPLCPCPFAPAPTQTSAHHIICTLGPLPTRFSTPTSALSTLSSSETISYGWAIV